MVVSLLACELLLRLLQLRLECLVLTRQLFDLDTLEVELVDQIVACVDIALSFFFETAQLFALVSDLDSQLVPHLIICLSFSEELVVSVL